MTNTPQTPSNPVPVTIPANEPYDFGVGVDAWGYFDADFFASLFAVGLGNGGDDVAGGAFDGFLEGDLEFVFDVAATLGRSGGASANVPRLHFALASAQK